MMQLTHSRGAGAVRHGYVGAGARQIDASSVTGVGGEGWRIVARDLAGTLWEARISGRGGVETGLKGWKRSEAERLRARQPCGRRRGRQEGVEALLVEAVDRSQPADDVLATESPVLRSARGYNFRSRSRL